MKKAILFVSILCLSFCTGENKGRPHAAHEQGHTHAAEAELGTRQHPSSPGEEMQAHAHKVEEHLELKISRQRQTEWGIVVGSPILQKISSRISLPGNMTFNENKTAHITSFAQGQIAFLSSDLGDRIQKGQTLATINSPEFGEVQADYMRAWAAMNLRQKEYDRAKMLLEAKAIEEKEYLRRKAEFEKLATEYGALESKLHSFGLTHEQTEQLIADCNNLEDKEFKCVIADPNLALRSPVSGTVIYRDAIIGEHIAREKILFTVSDLSKLWAILDAYEKDIPKIDGKSTVTITSPLYPDRQFPGKITYISDVVDELLRTVKIRVEIANTEGLLKPNMYIQGMIETRSTDGEMLAVPENAVLNMNGESIIFIMEDEEMFAARPIRTGEKIGDYRLVIDGLNRNEMLVVEGAFTIKSELSKGTFGHVHVH
ncbi:MAG: efflux RND transporter periplasmic adaptor subunit [Candidatus Aminicenantes bacterium]|nr:efflux RND transporter periplasmic adaptor subunit [Candidatus Aminicenantes bacterium]